MRSFGVPAGRWLVGFLFVGLGVQLGCGLGGYFKGELVYVTASVLNLREQPTTKAPVLKRLNRGEELEVLEKGEGWLRVETGEEVVGWVHGNYVGDPAAVRAALKQDLVRRPQKGRKPRVRSWPRGTGSRRFSVEGMLAGLPEEMEIEEVDPIEGQARSMGVTADGQVVVEFWGNPEGLSRASVMVSVVDVPDEDLSRNAELAARFVRNAVPIWTRDGAWMADKLRELTSQDIGKGGFDGAGKKVRFEFIKPLGSVRISIDRKT